MTTYKSGTFLEGRCGNNAFAYEARGKGPRLFIPAVREGGLGELAMGDEIAFADFDEHDVLRECRGLREFLWMDWNGVPMVVFDNHNHAFYFWYEAVERGLLQRGATLIHFDQHKDMRQPEMGFVGGDLDAVARYTNEVLNVGNYIVPALEEGLLAHVALVTGEADLEKTDFLEEKNKILNIDLDFFAPELDYINFARAKDFLLAHLKTAKLVTVATSPFFIDQELALEKLSDLTKTK